jgi:hypothetical protein
MVQIQGLIPFPITVVVGEGRVSATLLIDSKEVVPGKPLKPKDGRLKITATAGLKEGVSYEVKCITSNLPISFLTVVKPVQNGRKNHKKNHEDCFVVKF